MSDELDDKMLMLGRFADQMSEHFDSVLILCSGPVHDGEGGSGSFRQQRGNVFAHEGLVRDWLRKTDGYHHAFHGEAGRKDAERINRDNDEIP